MSRAVAVPSSDEILILLATYNGEKFIREQISSVIGQSYSRWRLWIRDDCSSDRTRAIIAEFCAQDSRITMVSDGDERLGACQNFGRLLASARDSQYVMFCDQDDIWFPDKIERSLNAMKVLEARFGPEDCYLVYGTYTLVDEGGRDLNLPSPDFSPHPSLKSCVSQNYVYGCTMLLNRKLVCLSDPVPIAAENHDFWIVLTALANGAKFTYIAEPLLSYRQHSANVSGSYRDSGLVNRAKRFANKTELKHIASRKLMLECLIARFETAMSKSDAALVKGYLSALTKGGIWAAGYAVVHRLRRRGWAQTLLFYFNLLRLR